MKGDIGKLGDFGFQGLLGLFGVKGVKGELGQLFLVLFLLECFVGIIVNEIQMVLLKCMVNGDLKLLVMWYKMNLFFLVGCYLLEISGVLVVKNVKVEDDGVYICKV